MQNCMRVENRTIQLKLNRKIQEFFYYSIPLYFHLILFHFILKIQRSLLILTYVVPTSLQIIRFIRNFQIFPIVMIIG
jgi:hypothetical protein